MVHWSIVFHFIYHQDVSRAMEDLLTLLPSNGIVINVTTAERSVEAQHVDVMTLSFFARGAASVTVKFYNAEKELLDTQTVGHPM